MCKDRLLMMLFLVSYSLVQSFKMVKMGRFIIRKLAKGNLKHNGSQGKHVIFIL